MLKLTGVLSLLMVLLPLVATAGNPTVRVTLDAGTEGNLNRIADSLEDSVATLVAKGLADKSIGVIVTLFNPPNNKDDELFRSYGGVVTHRYTHALYGYAGTIPAYRIAGLAHAWGNGLCLVEVDSPLLMLMDVSVPQTRARPLVWDTTNGYGLDGDPGTTICIFDTGIDDTHPDLAGKLAFWHDFHDEREPDPVDRSGHGTAVAGIISGTGAVYGSTPLTSIGISLAGIIETDTGFAFPLDIPTVGNGTMTTTLIWEDSEAQGCVEFGLLEGTRQGPACSGGSPFSQVWDVSTAGTHEVWLGFPSGADRHFFALQTVIPYQQIGDGFNLMTGMAPGCRLASAKVLPQDASGLGLASAYIAACDSMAAINVHINMKVANASIGSYADATRWATDAVVRAGTVFAVAAGNSYPTYTIPPLQLADLAITVGAVNNAGLLTYYSSKGHSGSSKPDVVAPGGSFDPDDLSLGRSIYMVDSNWEDGAFHETGHADVFPDDYKSVGLGTSFASPHVAGLAALVIEALESNGYIWSYTLQDALLVKSIILLTATETNLPRDNNAGGDPPLNRGGKDNYEGYGMINADAAVEAVLQTWPSNTSHPTTITFGDQPADRRCWAATLNSAAASLTVNLTVPATLDADIYLYVANTFSNGDPILMANSINPNQGDDESLIINPTPGLTYYLTIKRISGFGDVSLLADAASVVPGNDNRQTRLIGSYPNPFNSQVTISFECAEPGLVKLTVYDLAGRRVADLVNGWLEAGSHIESWQGRDAAEQVVATGQYFVRLQTPDGTDVQKIMLAK